MIQHIRRLALGFLVLFLGCATIRQVTYVDQAQDNSIIINKARASGDEPLNTEEEVRTAAPIDTKLHESGGYDVLPRCANEERKRRLRESCQRHPELVGRSFRQNDPATYSHVMVDDKHRVLYCYVPKAGCSSWKHLIALQSGKTSLAELEKDWNIVHVPDKAESLGLHRLSSNTVADIKWKMANYTKFLVVRHPFSRLFSAYVDKFVWFYRRYARVYYADILRQFYPDAPIIGGDRFITFEQLVKLIVSAYKEGKPYLPTIDEHWRTINGMCHPCFIDYDYIAKMETMDEDLPPLLKLFNATELPSVHVMEEDEARRKNTFNYTRPTTQDAYASLPADLIKQLTDVFRADFHLFGYDYVANQEPVCGHRADSGSCC